MNSKAPLEAKLPPLGQADPDTLLASILEWVEESGLSLYAAQEEAILELFAGASVVLNTPTGSGKSLVATALCFKALAENQCCFYTAPIKALVSEKFFDLCKLFGPRHVGMMTGDASINQDAPIVCCTAEVLSNYALREGEQADVQYVVMDEFHYYGDRDRGIAWQIPLLTLPQSRFLLMSATLGSTTYFQQKVEALTGMPCVLVKTEERPVPLDYSYSEKPIHETISELLSAEKFPLYIVHFTQRSAAEQAQNLMSLDFLSKEKKTAIRAELVGFRFDTAFGSELKRYLHHGIGVHHAGMLPKYRRIVEQLAQRGHLQMICGTDTLGVGVNIPIRTVLLTKLCKYDGAHTKILSVRDFKQIAGRAGRRGYDTQGSVVVQAPEHVIENRIQRQKAEGDPKKLRKLRPKKPPEKGYAPWDEGTLTRLLESEPERLSSCFYVSHSLILNVLSRPDGCRALKALLRSSHESPKQQRQHGRTALAMFRSLVEAGVVSLEEKDVSLGAGFQDDFSLNQALSLYVVETVRLLDEALSDYPLRVMTLVESILETPGIVIAKQLDKLKAQAISEMKAEGVEYDERIARLEKIEHVKPDAEFIYDSFNAFRARNPWVGQNIRPKSIAREMFEEGMTFREYVKEYGLARSEGVLLRYLSDVYKTLQQSVPEDAKTQETRDMIDWLSAVVKQIDSSLIDEWEQLTHPEEPVKRAANELSGKELSDQEDIVETKGFVVLIRNDCFRFVKLLARSDYEGAIELLSGLPRWTTERLAEALAPYHQEHATIRTDPKARAPKCTQIDKADVEWVVRQVLLDDEDFGEWHLEFRVDLEASRAQGRPALRLTGVFS
ncbi:MAG: DUF3516 domain-containing protein [Myxococcota bacterium]